MDFEEYLAELAAKKTALSYRERIARALGDRKGDIAKLVGEIHAYALKHHIASPEEAVKAYEER